MSKFEIGNFKMNRNPINIIQEQIQKATSMIILALRATIHSSRSKKFNKIDLRKFKSDTKKKERIRLIIYSEAFKAKILFNQMLIISSQLIKKQSFESGGYIVGEISKENQVSVNEVSETLKLKK